jgi:hypothetical protein
MPRIENAKWNPKNKHVAHPPSQTLSNLRNMQIGDCKRIVHDDIKCSLNKTSSYNCSLVSFLATESKKHDYKYEYYHEKKHVAVVKRIK